MDDRELLEAYEHLATAHNLLLTARQHVDDATTYGARLPSNTRQYITQSYLWIFQELDTIRQEIRKRTKCGVSNE